MPVSSITARTDLRLPPSPAATAPPALERAPRPLHSARPVPHMATLPMCAAAGRQEPPLVFAAPRAARRSPGSRPPRVRPPTHPGGRWPSSWPNPAGRLVSMLLRPLLSHSDTIPSSSSAFRTSLLVYHLLP